MPLTAPGNRVCAALLFAAGLIGVPSVDAASYRDELQTPPVEVYVSMFQLYKQDEFGKLYTSLDFLRPITEHIRDKFNIDTAAEVRKAMEERDRDRVQQKLAQLVILDTFDLMDEGFKALKTSPQNARVALKAAQLNYQTLSLFWPQKDPDLDRTIRSLFQSANTGIQTEPMSYDRVKSDLREVQQSIARMFPGVVSPAVAAAGALGR
jgi:hypothetical protein